MPRTMQVRKLSEEEHIALEQLARSRTAPVRQVERARVALAAIEGESVSAIAARFHMSKNTVYLWLRRFNAMGMAGLEDRPRSGRPPKYTPEEVTEVINTAKTSPRALGLSFASWTLDRLATYLREHRGITMKRSRIDEILLAQDLHFGASGSRRRQRSDE
jgi:transposase